jgi:MFS family permease
MSEYQKIKKGLRISIVEGAFAHVLANLVGSIFLPSFALLLGANAFQIGLLASIQFFSTLAQIPGSLLVEKLAHRKIIAVLFAFLSRALWLPLIVAGFWLLSKESSGVMLNLLIFVVIGYHVLAAISGVSWLSWMSSMVPEEIRGRFFGLRNSILGMVTIVITIAGGNFLDLFPGLFPDLSIQIAFFILFSIACLSGLISGILLFRQPELERPQPYRGGYHALYTEPLRNQNFRRLLYFAVVWSFAVNFAAPFYVVYMLKDLHINYTLISVFTVASALADLTGMGIWGHYSDHFGNRPIMIITASLAGILPFLWIFTSQNLISIYFLIPLFHMLGGYIVSGYNLTSVNLVLRSVPAERNSIYFAFWAASNGIMAGFGALCGGLMATSIQMPFSLFHLEFSSVYKVIFLTSSILRLSSLFFLLKVQEEKGAPVRRVIRILRNVRSWASMMGYHPVLQFFLPAKDNHKNKSEYWPIWQFRKSVN